MKEQITNEELVNQYKDEQEPVNKNAILNRIIEQNMPMIYDRIYAITRERRDISKQDKEDLAQESMIALMETVESYNSQLASFNTYAYAKVEFRIRDWLEKNHHPIYIPRQKQRDVAQYYDIINNYKRTNNGRTPSDEYVKKMMGVNENTYRDIKAARDAYNIISLDDEVKQEDGTITAGENIPDERDYYFEKIIQDNKVKFQEIIMKLKNKKERKVLIDYFFNEIEWVKIAQELGVTKQRINTIKKKAYEHLASLPEVNNIAIELEIKPLDS